MWTQAIFKNIYCLLLRKQDYYQIVHFIYLFIFCLVIFFVVDPKMIRPVTQKCDTIRTVSFVICCTPRNY